MGDAAKVAFIIGLATVINVTARIREGKEPVSPIIGSGILMAFLFGLGSLFRWDIVIIIAALFLTSSLVIKGAPFVAFLSGLVAGTRN